MHSINFVHAKSHVRELGPTVSVHRDCSRLVLALGSVLSSRGNDCYRRHSTSDWSGSKSVDKQEFVTEGEGNTGEGNTRQSSSRLYLRRASTMHSDWLSQLVMQEQPPSGECRVAGALKDRSVPTLQILRQIYYRAFQVERHIKISRLCALRYHRTFATSHRLASALEFSYRNTRPFSIQRPRLLVPGVLDPRTFLVFLLSSEPFRPPPGTFKHAVFH